MSDSTRRWTPRQYAGGALLLGGFALTVVLAFLASGSRPPSQATYVLLAILTILANAGASWMFNGAGRADPTHAKQSVVRLITLAHQASRAKERAETAFDANNSKNDLHAEIGKTSVELSYIEDGLVGAINDWRAFHPYAVGQAELVNRDTAGAEDDG